MTSVKVFVAAFIGAGILFRYAGLASAQAPDANQTGLSGSTEPDAPTAPKSFPVHADTTAASEPKIVVEHRSVALDVPRVAYTDTAFGVAASALGIAGFGEARNGVNSESNTHFGGGLRIWGAPIDRLLLVLDAQRNDETNKFAPAVTAQFRVLGSEKEGWALGVLARYKAEGFADLGGEMEAGILGSIASSGFHLDTNVVAGADFDGGESDGEFLARGGYDVLKFLRLGAETRIRYRLTGHTELPGTRAWDAFGGGQLLASADHYFGAVTAGPSTVGLSDKVGWSAIASVGGVMF